MEPLILELDFTDKTPAGGGLGYLSPGQHQAAIIEFRHYADSNRLYCYLLTEGIRHRESFSLSEKGMPFLMALLVSAGMSADKLTGKQKIPFHKFVGRSVYFSYTPPTMGANGQPVENSYPSYRFYAEAQYNSMVAAANSAIESIEIEETPPNGSNGQAVPATAPAPAAATDGNFDFLVE